MNLGEDKFSGVPVLVLNSTTLEVLPTSCLFHNHVSTHYQTACSIPETTQMSVSWEPLDPFPTLDWVDKCFFTAESFDPYGRRRHQSVAQTLSMPEIMDAISPAELGVLDFIGLRLLGCIQTFLIWGETGEMVRKRRKGKAERNSEALVNSRWRVECVAVI